MSVFKWTTKVEEAAMLVAQDELSNEEIARRVGITRQGLDKWKLRSDFQNRVEQLTVVLAEAIKGRGIAERQNRVAELDDEWNRMRRLRDARAVEYANVPGGDTGLLVRQVKQVRVGSQGSGGRGQETIEVVEYVLDVGLLKEMREHAKQAAQELGQWNGEREAEATVLIREYVGVDLEQL